MHTIKTILLLLFVAAIVLFTFQNMEIVKINFLNWHLETPSFIASVSFYILGALSGGLIYSILKNLSNSKPPAKKTKKTPSKAS
jgi:lipopolysaccharide assembly protein A